MFSGKRSKFVFYSVLTFVLKTQSLHLNHTLEYLFCYFKVAVVMGKRAKAKRVLMSYLVLGRTSNNYYCFRNNTQQMQIIYIIFLWDEIAFSLFTCESLFYMLEASLSKLSLKCSSRVSVQVTLAEARRISSPAQYLTYFFVTLGCGCSKQRNSPDLLSDKLLLPGCNSVWLL